MTVFSNSMVHLKTKLFMMSGVLAWLCLPICTSTILVQALYPFNIPVHLDYLQTWLGASAMYLYFIGYIRQFPIHRYVTRQNTNISSCRYYRSISIALTLKNCCHFLQIFVVADAVNHTRNRHSINRMCNSREHCRSDDVVWKLVRLLHCTERS